MSEQRFELHWPVPQGATSEPVWTGSDFEVDGRRAPFLSYGGAQSNWSEELTHFHEQVAYDGHPIDLVSRSLALQTLREHCRTSNPVILESGSSSGFFIQQIRREAPEFRLVGSDFSAPIVERLAERVRGCPVVQLDLRSCPFLDNTFDAVVSLNVLEHIDDDCAAMREIRRILKPGGVAHVEVPASPACYDFYDEHLMHHRRYKASELRKMAENEGLEVVRLTHLGAFIFPAFFLVKQRNKRLVRRMSLEQKEALLASQIQATQTSPLFSWALKLEKWLGRWTSYPFGIRCVLVLRKPLEDRL